ncbi:MAG: phage tail protein I [Clostridiales bacterium]|nr:phage tail protein I [Clostridiales bacterium]
MSETGLIQKVDLTQTLPLALTYDEASVALAKALAVGLQEAAQLAKEAGIYYRIDELPETMLDILATDLHVDWYDANATLEEKRSVIASSVFVHRKMGTPSAVQRLLDDNFGGGAISEWFDYEGEPYHFRVSTESMELVYANLDQFITMLEKTKKASAVLDGIDILQTIGITAGVGMAKKTELNCTYTSETVEDVETSYTWIADEEGNTLTDETGMVILYEEA